MKDNELTIKDITKKKDDCEKGFRKESLASLDNIPLPLPVHHSKPENPKESEPEDRFFYVHILFFLIGLVHFIPYTFFVNANAYWMYKFRDVNANITDTDARTWLQTHFSPASNVINQVFSPVTVFLSTFFGFMIKARTRVLVAQSIITTAFTAGTALVKVDTDSWQVAFFVITVILLTLINISNSAISAANFAILSRFPRRFMKSYLMGEGSGGLVSAVLQIISLSFGTSTEVSALFYFLSGMILLIVTLILFYFSKYNKLYTYHINSVVEDTRRKVLTFSEVRHIAGKIWVPILTFFLLFLTLTPILPNITTLVVSENYGSGSEWSDKYFVPVITFLYGDILGLAGRILSSKSNASFTGVPLCIFMFVRMIILVPLVYLCNAQPRHHLPVVFGHDWEYIVILGIFHFSTGFLLNMAFLDIGKLVGPEKAEDAYLVLMLTGSWTTVILTPIGMFSVDVL